MSKQALREPPPGRQIWEDWGRSYPDPYLSVGRSSDQRELEVITRDIVRKLDLKSGDSLLDIGCGSGVLLGNILKQLKSL